MSELIKIITNTVAYNEHLSNSNLHVLLNLYKNDLNYFIMFLRGETLDRYLLIVILKPFSPWDWPI